MKDHDSNIASKEPKCKTTALNLRIRRAINFFIDTVLILTVFLGLAFTIETVWLIFFNEQYPYSGIANGAVSFAVVVVFAFLYFSLLEWFTGRTLGKLLTFTVVVPVGSQQLKYSQIAKRTICRFIPFECFSYLLPRKQGLHDRIASTTVVRHADTIPDSDSKTESDSKANRKIIDLFGFLIGFCILCLIYIFISTMPFDFALTEWGLAFFRPAVLACSIGSALIFIVIFRLRNYQVSQWLMIEITFCVIVCLLLFYGYAYYFILNIDEEMEREKVRLWRAGKQAMVLPIDQEDMNHAPML